MSLYKLYNYAEVAFRNAQHPQMRVREGRPHPQLHAVQATTGTILVGVALN